MDYPEELLYFIWRYRLYNQGDLKTTQGEVLKVIDVGQRNYHAGPDFELATIQLGGVIWRGHIEMHVKEDDWTRHGHHLDTAYTATILHVVWQSGVQPNLREDGTCIPTLVLSAFVDIALLDRYDALRKQERKIACEGQFGYGVTSVRPGWLQRLTLERLQEKYKHCSELLDRTKKDWERTFLIVLGRAFGTNINADAFEELMFRVEPRLVYKYQDAPEKIAAMLFGLSGFLEGECDDDYFVRLKKEYQILQRMYGLEEVAATLWKFMRARPYNFPTYRLGQLSGMITASAYWFEKICTVKELNELLIAVRAIDVDDYWSHHFRFGRDTKYHSKGWSNAFFNHLVINCFVPMLFSYGQFIGNEELKERAVTWLEQLPCEQNSIVTFYRDLGLSCQNAADSQALIQLKREYCSKKRCLECAIGLAILKA
ncbi:DUF2851 family protein [Sphingobacterium yanglingense]|uniref:Uncharacterized protein DUF2851 n=1 Tax=Sphingobacterium yanglingense TaxID=1437280 RepID=A0A4R6W9H3_9SPHI|nr:DUF2851 family protein [Sphingobacterium yanglingense]TDQ73849.1 uncharacterized protein DUF2851 [Sphingobacterium yanglingense]